MKKKALVVFVTILVLLPFLEGLFSISSIWRSSANENSASEELIQNDYLKLVQSLRETEDGAFIDLIFDKKEAEADTMLKLHVMDEDGNKVAIQDENKQFEAGEDDWEVLKETKRAVDGTVSLPLPKDTQYTLYASLLELTEGEDGEVVERELLSKDELKGKPLIIAESAAPLDTTDRSNNDPLTLVAIDGFKVTFESTSKDQGQKADWKITFDKNLAKDQNYKIRYSFYDPQNPVSRNEDGSTSRFKSIQINGRNYREEETAGRSNKFTLAFHTNATYMKAEIGLVDEDGNYIQLFNADKVDMVDKAAAEAARKKAEEEAAAKKAAEEAAKKAAEELLKQQGPQLRSFNTFSGGNSGITGTSGAIGNQILGYDESPVEGSFYYDVPGAMNELLRAAGHFHVFTRDFDMGAHLNGNFATQKLTKAGEVASGTRDEKFYIQTLTNNSSFGKISKRSPTSKLVVGEAIDYEENGNQLRLKKPNNSYMDISEWTAGGRIQLQKDTAGVKYIDFDEEMKALNETSAKLAALDGYNFSNPQMNQQTLDLTDPNKVDQSLETVIVHFDYATLTYNNAAFMIKGLVPDQRPANAPENQPDVRNIIVNVEVPSNVTSFTIPQVQLQDYMGNTIGTSEKTNFTNSSILFNFYTRDAKGDVAPYEGKMTFARSFQGSVLATGARVHVEATYEGTMICDYFTSTTETHAWNYSPRGSVTLIKRDGGINGAFLKGAVFQIWAKDVPTGVGKVEDKLITTLTTDEYGRLNYSGLPQGEYFFREITAPIGPNQEEYELLGYDIPFTITPGLNVTKEYVQAFNTRKQKDFKFKARKRIATAANEAKTFKFEIQDKNGDAVAWGRADIEKDNTGYKDIVFYKTEDARDKKTASEVIGENDWTPNILKNGESYQLVETDSQGYKVQFEGANAGRFTANYSENSGVHINIDVTNYKDPLTLEGKKTINGKVNKDQTFKFEIREGELEGKVVAYGKATVSANELNANIEFFEKGDHTVPIPANGWGDIIDVGKDYYIVETDNLGYKNVVYKVDGNDTQKIEFTAGGVNNITFEVNNSNDEVEPKIELVGIKKLEGETLTGSESKTFTFELRKQAGSDRADSDPVMATGEAIATPSNLTPNIIFKDGNNILDTAEKWTTLLEAGATYYIVETNIDASEYTVKMEVDGDEKDDFKIPDPLVGGLTTISFICTNTKQEKHFKFGAEKKVTGTADLGSTKTFEFIIYEKGDTSKTPVAIGTVDVTAKNTDVAITFTTPTGDTITDWKSILADGKTYVLEETTPGYEITYTGGNVAGGAPNEFKVTYSADADSAAANVNIHVKNDRNEGWLPSTGGAGTMIFGAVALAAVAAAGGFGFVYWKRNRKA